CSRGRWRRIGRCGRSSLEPTHSSGASMGCRVARSGPTSPWGMGSIAAGSSRWTWRIRRRRRRRARSAGRRWRATAASSGRGGKVSGTTIGPRWPEMQLSGVVYMEIGHWERLPAKLRFPRPPRDVRARDYEHTRTVYWSHTDDPRAGRRYAGFHVELLELRET